MSDQGIRLSDFMTGAETLQPDSGNNNPPDGVYEYECTGVTIQRGTAKDPQQNGIVIKFALSNGERTQQWFNLPKVFGQETDKEKKTMQRYLRFLVEMGIPRNEVNTVDAQTLIGRTGVFKLVTTTGQDNREYQNIRDIRPSGVTQPQYVTPAQPAFAGQVVPAPVHPAQVSVGQQPINGQAAGNPFSAAPAPVQQGNPFG